MVRLTSAPNTIPSISKNFSNTSDKFFSSEAVKTHNSNKANYAPIIISDFVNDDATNPKI